MSKEKPILFSTEMVRAILDGRKSQTRRVIKPQPIYDASLGYKYKDTGWYGTDYGWRSFRWAVAKYCRYQPGDILWVKETWSFWPSYDCENENCGRSCIVYKDNLGCFIYRSTINDLIADEFNWKPSIHMPKAAARLSLKVKNVRVERLQDITEDDAKAEGILDGGCLNCGNSSYPNPCGCNNPSPNYRDSFAYLWNRLNEKRGYGWHANPWVWVIEFEQVWAQFPGVSR